MVNKLNEKTTIFTNKNLIIMKKIFIISILIFSCVCYSQEKDENLDFKRNKGFFNITKFGYINVLEANLETFSPTNGVVVTDLVTDSATAFSLHTINGYFINPFLSVGIGIGLDGYRNPTYNTLPLFFDFRAYLMDEKSSPYLYFDYGTLIKIEGDKNNGSIFNIGFGYKFPINKKRFMLLSDISYSYKSISNDGLSIRNSESWTQIKGIMIGVGVIF